MLPTGSPAAMRAHVYLESVRDSNAFLSRTGPSGARCLALWAPVGSLHRLEGGGRCDPWRDHHRGAVRAGCGGAGNRQIAGDIEDGHASGAVEDQRPGSRRGRDRHGWAGGRRISRQLPRGDLHGGGVGWRSFRLGADDLGRRFRLERLIGRERYLRLAGFAGLTEMGARIRVQATTWPKRVRTAGASGECLIHERPI